MSMYSHIARYGEPQTQGAQSLIENRQPLGDDIDQHFVEWFSGDALDSIWTQVDGAGTGTFAMVDAIDGGFSITCGSNLSDSSQINFNGIEHYSGSGCAFIAIVMSVSSTDMEMDWGLRNGTAGHMLVFNQKENTNSFVRCGTRASSSTFTDSTLASSTTTWHTYRAVSESSLAKFWIDGIFESVHTTNLPTDALQPRFRVSNDISAAREGRIRYYEVYNT